jgi:hypothetical protein
MYKLHLIPNQHLDLPCPPHFCIDAIMIQHLEVRLDSRNRKVYHGRGEL